MLNRAGLAAILGAMALMVTACGSAGTSPPEPETTVSVETTAIPAETTADDDEPMESISISGEAPPQITYSQTYAKYTASVLQQDSSKPAFAELGEQLAAGVAARDDMVELVLDLTLERELTVDMYAEVVRRVQAGEVPDLLEFSAASTAASLAPGGYLGDLQTLPTLQDDHPAFDRSLNRELTVAGHAYFLFGDATTGDKAAASAVLVDLAAAENAGISPDKLCDMVMAGDWTAEALLEAAQEGNVSLNGDAVVPLFLGFGGKIFDHDAVDRPILTTGEAFSLAYAAMQETMSAAAAEEEPVFTVGSLADWDETRLLLPIPALEEGKPYLSAVDPHKAACMAIPAEPADLARTGDILTAYFTEATDTILRPIRTYLANGNDDAVVDKILSSRTCALGALFGWGDLAEALTESIGMGEREFLDSVKMRMITAEKAMEIFVSRIG